MMDGHSSPVIAKSDGVKGDLVATEAFAGIIGIKPKVEEPGLKAELHPSFHPLNDTPIQIQGT